ncbi:amino acid ABC transporter permease [Paraburkholderia susongensis]|uniref:Glutamate/aspartate import permease protein GltK n=1 Tax=Paraburkholderia susongensis TaxID=1515439 RepID=A0A1X7LNX2_9BURK|nr:amino acid ABC transporter permease [Paraburkholderia susongensis]SMG55571.1 amino acid ABC transporter membrane protein, PAAT family [Paraburkholderia susongensis]
MYQWNFDFLLSQKNLLISGAWFTIKYTILCVALGLAVGMVAALSRLTGRRVLSGLANAYVEAFRCTPVLVQLIWFYYALPVLLGVNISPELASVLALSLYGGAFYSEIIRGGITSIDRGQTEAGQALGMRAGQIMRRIVLPQAMRRMVAPLMNQSIMQLKNTSLLSVLAVPDLVYQGQSIAHETYRPLECYTVIALIYLIILLPATFMSRKLERGAAFAN